MITDQPKRKHQFPKKMTEKLRNFGECPQYLRANLPKIGPRGERFGATFCKIRHFLRSSEGFFTILKKSRKNTELHYFELFSRKVTEPISAKTSMIIGTLHEV